MGELEREMLFSLGVFWLFPLQVRATSDVDAHARLLCPFILSLRRCLTSFVSGVSPLFTRSSEG